MMTSSHVCIFWLSAQTHEHAMMNDMIDDAGMLMADGKLPPTIDSSTIARAGVSTELPAD